MLYLLQVSICWALFYALYWLMYRNETFFRMNRLYLLSTLLLGIVLPLDSSKIGLPHEASQVVLSVVLEPLVIGSQQAKEQIEGFSFSYQTILWYVYSIGFVIVTIRFLMGLVKLRRLFLQSETERHEGFYLSKTPEIHLPFSFYNTVFVSSKNEMDAAMLRHEVAHIQQKHSLDVLLLEVLMLIFWCSPVIYWYKKSLRAVHEYLADEAATQICSKQEYGTMLLRQLPSGMQPTLANSFIHSQLKQRFVMMLKPSSPHVAYLKYVVCVPIIFMLSILLHQESVKAQKTFTEADGTKVTAYDGFDILNATDTIVTFDPVSLKESVRTINRTDTIFLTSDVPAHFIGGQDSLMHFLFQNVKYPKEAREAKSTGKAVVQFVVNTDGLVAYVKILKSSGNAILDEEAKRVVDVLDACIKKDLNIPCVPDFVPGTRNGKKVSTYFTLPIVFKL